MAFQNLYVKNEPDTTLYPAETDLLQDVLTTIRDRFIPDATAGTLILDGQKFGEPAQRILSFDLERGTFHLPIGCPCGRVTWVPSDTLAEGAIDEMLELPEGSGYRERSIESGRPIERDEQVVSGIYVSGAHQVLVVRTEYGRFLCSCYLDVRPPKQDLQANRTMLYAVAQALQLLDPPDAELRNFQIEADDHYAAVYAPVLQAVRDLIERRELPSIEKWAAWVAEADAQGLLTRFFK